MSGLFVKSTIIMRENLEEMNRRGLGEVPVLLGGAALTRKYVERDLRDIYGGPLFYGKDAFTGLRVMDQLRVMRESGVEDPDFGRRNDGRSLPSRTTPPTPRVAPSTERSTEVATDDPVFKPPFLGSRIVRGISIDEIARFVNETALFRNQWQFRPKEGENDDEFKERIRPTLREQLHIARTETSSAADRLRILPDRVGRERSGAFFDDGLRTSERTRCHFPASTRARPVYLSISTGPVDRLGPDPAALHIVTIGPNSPRTPAPCFEDPPYQETSRSQTESSDGSRHSASCRHLRNPRQWGFAHEDAPALTGLFRRQYGAAGTRGGYPACPELQRQSTRRRSTRPDRSASRLEAHLLPVSARTVDLGVICHHPRAEFFVGRRKKRTAMKVIEHLERPTEPLISFEIIPPRRGGDLRQPVALIEDLVEHGRRSSTSPATPARSSTRRRRRLSSAASSASAPGRWASAR